MIFKGNGLIKVDFLCWSLYQYKMSFTFSVPATNTPTHIVVWQDSSMSSTEPNVVMLTDRIAALENAISKLSVTHTSDASAAQTPLISGINMRRRDDSIGSLSAVNPPDVRNILNALISSPLNMHPLQLDTDAEVIEVDESSQQEDADADAEDETSQLDNADAEEEETSELQEFEYKGETYYKDAENLVYKMDEDGDLDDEPIGIWNEEKKKVLKYSKA